MNNDSRTPGIFITGTDTGVGKTWITGGLAGILRSRGLNVGVWKPVQSGFLPGEPEADSYILKQRSGVDDPETTITPFSFPDPLTPTIAAQRAGQELDLDRIIKKGQNLLRKYDAILVEGVGGLAVPLTRDRMIVDLAVRLKYPVVVISRPGLGSINHALLTVAYARNHGLRVLGVIFNGYAGKIPETLTSYDQISQNNEFRDSELTNPFMVQKFANIRVLGKVPIVKSEQNLAHERKILEKHIDLRIIISSLEQEIR